MAFALLLLATAPVSAEESGALGRTGVTVEQPEPQTGGGRPPSVVRIEQPPHDVDQPRPEPSVRVSPSQPRMDDGRPSWTVRVEQPQTAPEGGPPEGRMAVEQPARQMAPTPPPGAVRVDPDATARAAPATHGETGGAGERGGVPVARLKGRTVKNAAGREIGRVETVLLDETTGGPAVILSVGGLFGFWTTEVAFPYDELAIADDALVLDTRLTPEEVEAMKPYDEAAHRPLPTEMRAD
jgi:sporulation protein YlmC with PRC-barrel domain